LQAREAERDHAESAELDHSDCHSPRAGEPQRNVVQERIARGMIRSYYVMPDRTEAKEQTKDKQAKAPLDESRT